jgi:hypothetical protein
MLREGLVLLRVQLEKSTIRSLLVKYKLKIQVPHSHRKILQVDLMCSQLDFTIKIPIAI